MVVGTRMPLVSGSWINTLAPLPSTFSKNVAFPLPVRMPVSGSPMLESAETIRVPAEMRLPFKMLARIRVNPLATRLVFMSQNFRGRFYHKGLPFSFLSHSNLPTTCNTHRPGLRDIALHQHRPPARITNGRL